MVYQGATGLYHFLINVIPFISNCIQCHTILHYIDLTCYHTRTLSTHCEANLGVFTHTLIPPPTSANIYYTLNV